MTGTRIRTGRSVDLTTGQPAALSTGDWAELEFRGPRSGRVIHPSYAFFSDEAGIRVSLRLPVCAEPVAVSAPEHPLWIFEPIEVVEGAELVLRVTPR
ncbi:MAG: hypothetical protein AAFZ87_03690 [Planctomycetota bacterium]